jgi:cytochrome bd ubiquinol oxidase subunit II
MEYLPLIFVMIIGFIIIMYVILDGFTLGTGMLLPFMTKPEKDLAMSVILPNWDGNQTWLVLGGATLYGSFPMAFSILLPALYLPLILMVIALLFRGIVFEFRLKSTISGQAAWDVTFAIASLFVTFIQGLILGNFVEGFTPVVNVIYTANDPLITPFSLMTAVSLIFGYTLLGSTRLILKTTGSIQKKMFYFAKNISLFVAALMVIISLMTLFVHPQVKQLWFNHRYWPWLAILPCITGIVFLFFWDALRKKRDILPYWLAVILFLCPYAGFILSVYPYIVPYHLTFWEAASPANSLLFLLVGNLIMLPVLLFYTGYSYKIFKGKVKEVLHY